MVIGSSLVAESPKETRCVTCRCAISRNCQAARQKLQPDNGRRGYFAVVAHAHTRIYSRSSSRKKRRKRRKEKQVKIACGGERDEEMGWRPSCCSGRDDEDVPGLPRESSTWSLLVVRRDRTGVAERVAKIKDAGDRRVQEALERRQRRPRRARGLSLPPASRLVSLFLLFYGRYIQSRAFFFLFGDWVYVWYLRVINF